MKWGAAGLAVVALIGAAVYALWPMPSGNARYVEWMIGGSSSPEPEPEPAATVAGVPPGARAVTDGTVREQLLAIDEDGAALVAFYVGATETPGPFSSTYLVGEVPGVALVAPDGTRTTLLEPVATGEGEVTFANGDLHDGMVAVMFMTGAADDLMATYEPTLYVGARGGELELSPPLTFEGGGFEPNGSWIHLVDGSVATTGARLESHGVYTIDPATGVTTLAASSGDTVVTWVHRDLCAPAGVDALAFGGLPASGGMAAWEQWEATWAPGGGVAVSEVDIVAPSRLGIPSTSCGADSAAAVDGAGTGGLAVRHDGADRFFQLDPQAFGEVLLGADYLLAGSLVLDDGDLGATNVIRRADGAIATVGEGCGPWTMRGDQVAFGVGTNGACTAYVAPLAAFFAD